MIIRRYQRFAPPTKKLARVTASAGRQGMKFMQPCETLTSASSKKAP